MSDLVSKVDRKISKIRTTSLDISFSELLNMYKDKELIISPEYQRLFRWSLEKRSRFIETLMLELPLPPVFVIESKEGVYELIDGLQRISSYLHFRGEIEEEPLELIGCDIIPELDGHTYESLPTTLKIKLKRNFIRVEVLRKESENNLKYHMFKRLNSGGEILTEQEIRNCTIRLLDPKINKFIEDMNKNKHFQNTIIKIDKDEKMKKKDEELILRFFAFKNNLENFYFPLDEYLTDYMELIANKKVKFDYENEKETFKNTFMVLSNTLGGDIFSTENPKNLDTYKKMFTQYHFDGLTLGIQKYLEKIIALNDYDKFLSMIKKVKEDKDFYNARTGNKSGLKTRINIVEKILGEFFNENK